MSQRTLAMASIFGLCFGWVASAQAELYRYVDAAGDTQVVSDLHSVPPEYRASALENARARQAQRRDLPDADATAGWPATSAAPAQPESPRLPSTRPRSAPHAEPTAPAPPAAPSAPLGSAAEVPSSPRAREPQAAAWDEPWWRSEAQKRNESFEDAEAAWNAAKRSGRPGQHLLQADFERAARDLESFRERARRAGVPSDWLR